MKARQEPIVRKRIRKRSFFSVKSRLFRYTLLCIIAVIPTGAYFAYFEIQPLSKELCEELHIDKTRFGSLFMIYSAPNIVLALFGGALADKLGLRWYGIILNGLVTVGNFLVAGAAYTHGTETPFIVMMIGRFLFGVGADIYYIVNISMLVRYFSGTAILSTAFGVSFFFLRLADFLALAMPAVIAKDLGDYKWVLWIGGILSFVCLLFHGIYVLMDNYGRRRLELKSTEERKLNFGAIWNFDSRFWLLSLIVTLYYAEISAFTTTASDFLQDQFQYDSTHAGYTCSAISVSSMILSPIIGRLVDCVGRRTYLLLVSILLLIIAHGCLGFAQSVPPILCFSILGLSLALVQACVWPAIPMIIPEEYTSTAYGIFMAGLNLGMINSVVITALAQGDIPDSPDKCVVPRGTYKWNIAMLYLVALEAFTFMVVIVLTLVDQFKGGQLCETVKPQINNDEEPSDSEDTALIISDSVQ